jgi:hypothetical protein
VVVFLVVSDFLADTTTLIDVVEVRIPTMPMTEAVLIVLFVSLILYSVGRMTMSFTLSTPLAVGLLGC